MKKFFDIFNDDNIIKASECYAFSQQQSLIYGVAGTQKSLIIAKGYNLAQKATIIITSSKDSMAQLESDLSSLLPQTQIVKLPSLDVVSFSAVAKSLELVAQRLDVLGKLVRNEKVIVLTTGEAVIQKNLSKHDFEQARINLKLRMSIELENVLERLVKLGYVRVDEVEIMGEFSVRGGIIDVFPVNATQPIRIEFYGDEIDSVRTYDINSKLSLDSISQIDILPLAQPEDYDKMANCLSYLPQDSTVIFDEPARIKEQIEKILQENPEVKKQLFSWQEIVEFAKNYNILYLTLLLQKPQYSEPKEVISIVSKSVVPFHKKIELLANEIKAWRHKNYKIVIFMSTKQKALSLQEELARYNLTACFVAKEPIDFAEGITIAINVFNNGFELPEAKAVVVTEKEILGTQKKKPLQRVAKGEKIAYFRDINIGDYVVHINHGIGKYIGVETIDLAGIKKDYLHIKYAGTDKIFVPTDQVNLLQKYIGAEGQTPKLSKMGGTDWHKTKSKAKAAVADIAKELIELYATRQVATGFAFEQDNNWQAEFEDAFAYEETPDQLQAIKEIKADMEKAEPMDRLLCGDVGFGKTEVAVRAAFKAVMSGKQVAVLVPTTVLAQQHFQTFKSRFAKFGPVVDLICRFRTAKEQQETLEKVETGRVDVLVGTHRILNKTVKFKDLGLLIVDEEQRFGVAQKEKMKKLSAGIDCLTLSATPIPRTLHMSLVGARDMSIIETPPEERIPVQTYVVENNDEVIKDAIKRELKRGGQVYLVYNKVASIDKISHHLAQMLPDARIQTAHGQMSEALLEKVMVEFYEGKYDVLVCTSIIENGLDVPNANTIIVYDADHFGLSQLYQMRGRVGRSHVMAFAYLTYRKDKVLTEVAEKRLQAIKEFAELGAGFKIAMRDLEIRGAGNLLGAQQHGHIASVGFEMYCRLLEEAMQELKTGQPVKLQPEPTIEIKVEAYLSGDYINDAMHKIEFYQKIAAVRTEEHISAIIAELIDRFGEPSSATLNLLEVARIKNIMRELGIESILEQHNRLDIILGENVNINVENIIKLQEQLLHKVKILQGPPERILINFNNKHILQQLKKILGILAGTEKGDK